MPKLSLRIETLEKQVSELLLKDKKREKQNKRLELLEQQFKKTKSENLRKVENDFWYKYCKEIHKIYSRYYQLSLKFNPIILYFVITGVFISVQIIFRLLERKSPNLWYKVFVCVYVITLSFPIFLAFLRLKIYLQLKQYKKILIASFKEIFISFQTFIVVYSFENTVYSISKLL